jgi:hypothetical protein
VEVFFLEHKKTSSDEDSKFKHQPHQVRLPGFLIGEDIGLGDAIKRVTYAVGIKPCAGCEKRASALNRWMHFTR